MLLLLREGMGMVDVDGFCYQHCDGPDSAKYSFYCSG
jgi:hypothetical protein